MSVSAPARIAIVLVGNLSRGYRESQLGLTPIRKNNRKISGIERLRTPVTGILIVGLQLFLDLPRDGEALEPH